MTDKKSNHSKTSDRDSRQPTAPRLPGWVQWWMQKRPAILIGFFVAFVIWIVVLAYLAFSG